MFTMPTTFEFYCPYCISSHKPHVQADSMRAELYCDYHKSERLKCTLSFVCLIPDKMYGFRNDYDIARDALSIDEAIGRCTGRYKGVIAIRVSDGSLTDDKQFVWINPLAHKMLLDNATQNVLHVLDGLHHQLLTLGLTGCDKKTANAVLSSFVGK